MVIASDMVLPRTDDEKHREIVMPRLSQGLDRAAIVRWYVEAGQAVAEGDVLAEIAAGNTTMEVEAPIDGTVGALVAAAGADLLPAGLVIATLAPADPPLAAKPVTPPQPATAEPVALETVQPEATTQPTSVITFAEALRAGLAARMQHDPDVFVIGESVADFGRCSPAVQGLVDDFGRRRVVGTPITPAAAVGLAVGAAMAGLKPVVEFSAWALALQAIDPIVSSAARTRFRSGGQLGVPIVLRGRNGLWPGAGAMHGLSLASWLAAIPGLKVVCPATPSCAKGLMHAAILDPDPVIMLEPDSLYETTGAVPDADDWHVPIGKARLARTGTDLSIVTYGRGVPVALAAADILAESDVSCDVIDLRTLRPLDMPTVLSSVRKTGRLLALDDAPPACSISAEICAGVASAAFSSLKAPPMRMEAADTAIPYAPNLEELVLPDAGDVAAKALKLATQGL